MADPEVIRVMRRFKRDLLRNESAQMRQMAQRWLGVERRLMGQMDALAQAMVQIQADGGTVSTGMLFNDVRYRELLAQLRTELDGYTGYAERTIEARQGQLARLGIDHAEQAINATGFNGSFNRLPVAAVENMVGVTATGPLRDLLVESWPLAAEGITSELINGVALGYNPRKVARMMASGGTGSLQRMMVIARTEQLRVYRHANLESYKASGVVEGYRRLSARDSRVCAGCLAMDGAYYDLEVDFKSHPQCRCTLTPKVEGIPLVFQTGAEWFEEQKAETQRHILGAGRYDLWAHGDIKDFKRFATVRINATWGDAIVPTPLKALVGA